MASITVTQGLCPRVHVCLGLSTMLRNDACLVQPKTRMANMHVLGIPQDLSAIGDVFEPILKSF